jgi:hypothetical protein
MAKKIIKFFFGEGGVGGWIYVVPYLMLLTLLVYMLFSGGCATTEEKEGWEQFPTYEEELDAAAQRPRCPVGYMEYCRQHFDKGCGDARKKHDDEFVCVSEQAMRDALRNLW